VSDPEIVIDRVCKRFASFEKGKPPPPALTDISLAIEKGELVVLVGPSGCGKSTTLRIVAGLEEQDSGTVTIAGRAMERVPPQDRDLAMVFQGYALYPTMTVREILEFPLKMRGIGSQERARAAEETASLLRIDKLLARLPGELSGGERQRVAMGRAIVRKPRVFLFDEPLSNLDAALRGDIRLEIGALVRRLGATAIYVTHDHVEAMTLADRIAVMRAGRVLQLASPREIYERPATSFVGTFLGAPRMNLLAAKREGDCVVAGPLRVANAVGEACPAQVELGVRPEHVHFVDAAQGAKARIVAVEPLGAETHFVLSLGAGGAGEIELRVRAPGFDLRERGAEVHVAIDPKRVHLFDPAKDGARIGAD
jgi:multiple sugar transport system ATP-binding protein